MYEGFFKLQDRPFLAAPQTSRYFPATVIENARQTLERCIERSEGAGLIIGPSGTGKTLLCQMLAEQFEDRFSVALLASGRFGTRQALLQAILYELGLPYRGLNEGELRLALLDHLQPTQGNEGLLLLIDEAHTLPWRLLEEVRMMTNFVRDGQLRVRVVLAGSPLLEERFASPKMHSFSQRLAARCYLESLDSVETMAYVRAQIYAVGGDAGHLFHEDALRSIYRASDGIPRLINQVCDHALILASLGGMHQLTSEAIDEAWADLQQLPAPWTAAAVPSGAGDQVVEFGGLDDDLPEAIPFRSAAVQELHVTPPDDQLDDIQEQLEKIEDEFQPAGSIGTEVELDFPEFDNVPFGEEFAEEEVVLDRYNPDVDIFVGAPRVSSWEGQQLGSMLEPLDTSELRKSRVRSRPLSSERTWADDAESHSLFSSPSFGEATTEFVPAADPVLPDEPIVPRHVPMAAEAAREQIHVGVSSNRNEGRVPAASIPLDDHDLIVIEDDMPAPTKPRPAPLVRRLEYRQLFAKLRRG